MTFGMAAQQEHENEVVDHEFYETPKLPRAILADPLR
jgi:hypothetical protein